VSSFFAEAVWKAASRIGVEQRLQTMAGISAGREDSGELMREVVIERRWNGSTTGPEGEGAIAPRWQLLHCWLRSAFKRNCNCNGYTVGAVQYSKYITTAFLQKSLPCRNKFPANRMPVSQSYRSVINLQS